VVVGLGLPGAGGDYCCEIVAGFGDELDRYWQMFVGEACGDADGWEAAEVADGAHGVRVGEDLF